jgi:hypothetical protein
VGWSEKNKVISKRARANAKKIDAVRILLRLGFDETEGSRHTEYTLYDQDTGNQIAYTAISRSSKIDFLKSDELKSLRKALKTIGREDLYFGLIGAPKKKKKKKVIEKVPFFSAWANGVEKSLKALSFDRFITNIDETLYNQFAEDALRDDPTLDSESFRKELEHLVDLISNNDNHYISKLSTADVLFGIMMVNSYRDEVSVEDILNDIGAPLDLETDVGQHLKKLQDKGWVAEGDDIVLTAEGIEASASFVFSHKLLKLSRWMRNSGLRKEAVLILRLACNGD